MAHYAEAERDFEKLRELEPKIAEVRANLGLIYFQQGKFDQAVAELKQALNLKPGLPKLHSLLAMSLSELGRYSEALPELENCFQQPVELPVKRMCGLQLERAYSGLHRDNDAVQIALDLQRFFPNDPEILYHNERIYGNYAFQTIQQLVQVAPASIWRHQAAAEANESQGSYETAIGEYREVLKLDPSKPGVHYRIGRTLLARSRDSHAPADTAEALKEFQEELQVDPHNANSAYEIGEIYRQAGDLPKAQQFFELALRDHSEFEEAQLGLATVQIALQKPDLALPHLQQAVTSNPKNEVTWYRLSQVQRALGNSAEQKKALAEFQRLHAQEATRQNATPSEVTKQVLDTNATP